MDRAIEKLMNNKPGKFFPLQKLVMDLFCDCHAVSGSYGGQRLILGTPNPSQSWLPIGWMEAINESLYESKKDPGFENEIPEIKLQE